MNKKLESYILESVDGQPYDESPESPVEKLAFVEKIFNLEKGYEIERIGKFQAVTNWIGGLPSAINIEYRSHKILELGIEFGMISKNASEKRQDDFINDWFRLVGYNLINMIESAK